MPIQFDHQDSTVVAAYDQLLAQGLVEARPQRGFFVRDWSKIGTSARWDKLSSYKKSSRS
jgi:DNA-binding transcriptional MocR family regulator